MIDRSDLESLLARHEGADEKEREDLDRMRRLLRELERPFSRAQARAHFTGSAVVVDPAGERVCLVHHARLGRWLQPGGHADPVDGGSMLATALREAREETGCRIVAHPRAARPIDVDVHPIPERPGEPAHEHLDVRFLTVALDPEALRHDPGESLGARWLGWDEAQLHVERGRIHSGRAREGPRGAGGSPRCEEALATTNEPALSRLLRKAQDFRESG